MLPNNKGNNDEAKSRGELYYSFRLTISCIFTPGEFLDSETFGTIIDSDTKPPLPNFINKRINLL